MLITRLQVDFAGGGALQDEEEFVGPRHWRQVAALNSEERGSRWDTRAYLMDGDLRRL